jgi:hypothetical protein
MVRGSKIVQIFGVLKLVLSITEMHNFFVDIGCRTWYFRFVKVSTYSDPRNAGTSLSQLNPAINFDQGAIMT